MKVLDYENLVMMPESDVTSGDNVFQVLGSFKRYAKQQGTDINDVDLIIKHAMSSDYDNCIAVIKENTHLV